jgi:hypothetical protein
LGKIAAFIQAALNMRENVSKSFQFLGLYGIHLVAFANVIHFIRAGTTLSRDFY